MHWCPHRVIIRIFQYSGLLKVLVIMLSEFLTLYSINSDNHFCGQQNYVAGVHSSSVKWISNKLHIFNQYLYALCHFKKNKGRRDWGISTKLILLKTYLRRLWKKKNKPDSKWNLQRNKHLWKWQKYFYNSKLFNTKWP